MRYRVSGVDKDTGELLEITLEAPSESAARAAAQKRGVSATEVGPAVATQASSAASGRGLEQGHFVGAPVVNVALPRRGSSLGIASLVLGVLAFMICWIPFLNLLGVPLSALGLLLGLIGVVVALTRKGSGIGFPIAGIVVCGLALGVAILMTTAIMSGVAAVGDGIFAEQNESRATNQTSVGEGQSSGVKAEAAPSKSTDAQVTWAPAESPVRQGDVQVRITSVTVNKVKLPDRFGREQRESPEPGLVVALEIANLSETKKADYRTWGDDTFSFGDSTSLADNFGNSYRLVTFGLGERPEGGVLAESLYPGKSTSDVIVFEVPVEKAKFLDLTLPAKNFGGTGMIRLKIPASMVRR